MNNFDHFRHRTCRSGNERIFESLMSANIQYEVHNAHGYSPLCAAIQNGNLALVKALISQFPKSLVDVTSENRTVLHMACINGRNDIVEYLLRASCESEYLQQYR